MKPLIQSLFATGEDFGVRQDVIDEVFAEEGIRSSAESALSLVHDGADAAHARLKQRSPNGRRRWPRRARWRVRRCRDGLAALEFRGMHRPSRPLLCRASARWVERLLDT